MDGQFMDGHQKTFKTDELFIDGHFEMCSPVNVFEINTKLLAWSNKHGLINKV